MISFETYFLILFTDPHEADGVEGAFIVLVAGSPSALTNPDEPDGVAANAKVHAIRREAGWGPRNSKNKRPMRGYCRTKAANVISKLISASSGCRAMLMC